MHDDDRDGGGPAGVIDEQRLDELEHRALDAWRRTDALSESGDDLGVAPGFVDRVMAAEEGRRTPLFAVDLDALPEEAPKRPWRARLAAAGVAAVAGIAVAMAMFPGGEDPMAVVGGNGGVTAQTPEQFGDPGLRNDGTPGAPIPEDLAKRIESYIADYGRNWGPAFKFHGVVLVARDGAVQYARGFGVADPATGRPNTPTTRFRLGLLTEQFTAAAILQLRDEGVLVLDDPVARYLPEYPDGNEITIEQLLLHTSGLPNYTDFNYFHAWKRRPHTSYAMLQRIASRPLEFEPGSDFNPTNSGYFMLGALVERVTGLTVGQYVEEHIFKPAGMTASGFGDVYETGEQARGHVWNDEEMLDPPDPIDMTVFGGAGGLVASPMDLVTWDRVLYDGTVLATTSIEEMLTPDEDSGYGYGWVVSKGYGQRVVSFPGAIDGFNGSVMRFTEDRTLIVVLCNTEVVPGGIVARDVAMMVYGDTPQRRLEYPEVEIAPGTFPRYIGTYGVTDDTRERFAKVVDPGRFNLLSTVYVRQYGDRLYLHIPRHGLTWMHPMGHGRFFFKDHSGNTISFRMDDDRRANAMTIHYQDVGFELARK